MKAAIFLLMIFFIGLALATGGLMAISHTAYAEQGSGTQSILGLNSSNISNAIDSLDRLTNIAKLHNATVTQLSILTSQHNLLVCVQDLVDPTVYVYAVNTLSFVCDSPVTDMVVNHELGNNQTMIKIAHAYLKARGIQ
jgi:hypothetical protein